MKFLRTIYFLLLSFACTVIQRFNKGKITQKIVIFLCNEIKKIQPKINYFLFSFFTKKIKSFIKRQINNYKSTF